MLTNDMKRLCREIVTLRGMRASAMTELQQETKSREMAVKHLCSHFGHVRTKMAKQAKQVRMAFLDNLKTSVDALRKNMTDDLAGARKAWAGKTVKG
jgi:hypothetical protein